MPDYDASFLGVHLPLPQFTPVRSGDILQKTGLSSEGLATFPNYGVTTDRRHRSPAYTFLHIDQGRLKTTKRKSTWLIDSRIGAEWQLDDAYFAGDDNAWDRGHMADRESAAWGDSLREAQKSADETFYYANATLQHKFLNQDEWRGLEAGILKLKIVKAGRLTVFSGPVFGQNPRIVTPQGRTPAEVPVAFFKVVCFVNSTDGQLEVRAFLVFQDTEAMTDLRGRRAHNYTKYQVTITEIEQLTGLDFPAEVYERNPLFFHANGTAGARLNIHSFPERVDISAPEDIIHHDTRRIHVADDEVEVYLSAALIRPARGGGDEWVSLANYEPKAVKVTGWKLADRAGRSVTLKGSIPAGGTLRLSGAKLRPVKLPDHSGLLTLTNKQGDRIDQVDYTKREVDAVAGARGRQSLPVNFMTYRNRLRPE